MMHTLLIAKGQHQTYT